MSVSVWREMVGALYMCVCNAVSMIDRFSRAVRVPSRRLREKARGTEMNLSAHRVDARP